MDKGGRVAVIETPLGTYVDDSDMAPAYCSMCVEQENRVERCHWRRHPELIEKKNLTLSNGSVIEVCRYFKDEEMVKREEKEEKTVERHKAIIKVFFWLIMAITALLTVSVCCAVGGTIIWGVVKIVKFAWTGGW